MNHIAIFASGSGTNAENIVRYFEKTGSAKVALILCNNPKAGVVARAARLGIPCRVFSSQEFYETTAIIDLLKESATGEQIDLIVLAGFLWLVPAALIRAFPKKIINIHPALLPKYGGKGMYGMKVHEAVIQNKETGSGITIHFVNEHFDEGEIISQVHCTVEPGETPESLSKKIHHLEYTHFPIVIEEVLQGN